MTVIVVAAVIVALASWRLLVNANTKRNKHENVLPLLLDGQLQNLFAVFGWATVVFVLWFDFFSVEGIWTSKDVVVLYVYFGSMAIYAGLHVFISINSRFHPPSRLAAKGVVALALLQTAITICGAAVLGLSTSESIAAANALLQALGYLVAVVSVFGVSVYSVSVLRAATNAVIMLTRSAQEQQDRARSIRLLRAYQGCTVLIIGIETLTVFFTSAVDTVVLRGVEYLTALALCALILALFGRGRDSDERLSSTRPTQWVRDHAVEPELGAGGHSITQHASAEGATITLSSPQDTARVPIQ